MAADNCSIPQLAYRRRTARSDADLLGEMHRLFDYDPTNGGFIWKAARLPQCARYVGRPAGGPDGSGYLSVNLLRQKFKVHRLVWLWHHGESARGMLDHSNGIRIDNRIENLREATMAQNVQNRVRNGMLANGVSRDPQSGYKARIQLEDGSKVYLGTFDTEAEAAAAYIGAATIMHGEFAVHMREMVGGAGIGPATSTV